MATLGSCDRSNNGVAGIGRLNPRSDSDIWKSMFVLMECPEFENVENRGGGRDAYNVVLKEIFVVIDQSSERQQVQRAIRYENEMGLGV